MHNVPFDSSCYTIAYNTRLSLPYVVYFLCVFPSYCIYMNIYKEKAFGSFYFYFLKFYICVLFLTLYFTFLYILDYILFFPTPFFQMLFLFFNETKAKKSISLSFFSVFLASPPLLPLNPIYIHSSPLPIFPILPIIGVRCLSQIKKKVKNHPVNPNF